MVFPTDLSYGPPLNDQGGGWYVTMLYIKQRQRYLFLIVTMFLYRFAVERTDSDIKIWFWPRCSLFVPFDVRKNLNTVNPLTWVCENFILLSSLIVFVNKTYHLLQGFPAAHFPNTDCDMASHFSEENIIINLTLCKPLLFFFWVVVILYRNIEYTLMF